MKSVRQRKTSIYDIAYMWDLEYDINELIFETETDSWTYKTILCFPKRKGRRDKLGVLLIRYILVYVK